MKKQLESISWFAALAVLFVAISQNQLHAKQCGPPDAPQPQPSAQAPARSSDTQASPRRSTRTQLFSGTVVRHDNKYVFQADDGKTYDIDHQGEIKKYEGKKIRVQGTLDSSGKMIYAQ